MRILHVNTTVNLETGGGCAERLTRMALTLQRGGHSNTVVCSSKSDGYALGLSEQGVEVVEFRCLWKRLFIPAVNWGKLSQIVREAEVIQLMGHWSLLNVLVVLLARHYGRPYLCCPAGSLKVYGRSLFLKHTFNFLIGKLMVRGAACNIAVSDNELEDFAKLGVPFAKVELIPNGICRHDYLEGESNSFKKKLVIPDESPYILYLGRLNFFKGPDLLLEAFKKVVCEIPDLHLVFAGPDEGIQQELEEAVATGSLAGKVHFAGFISGQQKTDALYGSAVLVIPSRHDAMSIVVLESGITGTPVILTDQCGFPEVEQAECGYLCSATVESIEESLEKFFRLDDLEKEQMGQRFFSFVESNYSWESIIEDFVKICRKVTAEEVSR